MGGFLIPKAAARPGRNDPCPCGSGRKYKHCCDAEADRVDAAVRRARQLLDGGRFAEALAELDTARADGARASLALHLRAEALLALTRAEEAQQLLTPHLSLKPDDGLAWALLGQAHAASRNSAASIEALLRAAVCLPDHAAVHNNLGNALQNSGRMVEAAASFRRALSLDDSVPAAHGNLGGALLALGRTDEALRAYAAELARHGVTPDSYSNLLLAMHYADSLPPEQMAMAHFRYGEVIEGALGGPRQAPGRSDDPRRRLRVGWVSSDFRQHSVAFFLEPLIATLNRDTFSLWAYFNHPTGDAVTERLRQRFDGWRDIFRLDDLQLESLVREDAIDILIDLNGHTAGNRLPLFARRAAPVQLTWLGYPDTTGLRAMDWRITDTVADPPGRSEAFHTERLWRLDGGFLCYRPPLDAPAVSPRPAGGPLVFGSMNNHNKLSPSVLRAWARLMQAVPGSRLLLKLRGDLDAATAEVQLARLQAQGIHRERVEVIGRVDDASHHLRRYADIDIALDSFPYHGTTTTCDALWMGVPVVTLAGRHHAARVGASLLHAVGLGDLVADSEEAFVATASALARDAARRQQLRLTMRERLASSPLMDEQAFGQRFGVALQGMWQEALAGADAAGQATDAQPA